MSQVFFGAKIEPWCLFFRRIPKSLHITSLAIDKGDLAKIYFISGKEKYILATLSHVIPHASLDLKFSKTEKITFFVEGNATVFILGYWGEDEEDDEGEVDRAAQGKVEEICSLA